MDDLNRLREEIGALDRSVLETLNRRLELVRRVTRHKQETGTPLIDAEREAELLRELAEANAGPLSERAVQGVFAAVLDVMKQEARGDDAARRSLAARPGEGRRRVARGGRDRASSEPRSRSPRSGPGVARVTGWDADPETLREAVGAKALDASAGSLAEAVAGVELVVVAVPVGALVATTREVLAAASAEATVTDVGSTKRALAAGARRPAPRSGPSARRRRDRRARTRGRGPLRRRDLVPHAGRVDRRRPRSSSSSGSSRRSARARSGSTPRRTTGCSR